MPTRTKIPELARIACDSYRAGHHVHWIQALRTANDHSVSALSWWGSLVAVDGTELSITKEDGETIALNNHDPERLVAIAGELPVQVLVNDGYSILRIGRSTFSVTTEALPGACTDRRKP